MEHLTLIESLGLALVVLGTVAAASLGLLLVLVLTIDVINGSTPSARQRRAFSVTALL
jgi:hypothetical protein